MHINIIDKDPIWNEQNFDREIENSQWSSNRFACYYVNISTAQILESGDYGL